MLTYLKEKLEHLLNHALLLDPESKKRLARLTGKVVMIKLTMLDHIEFQLHFNEEGVKLSFADFIEADTTIVGTPLTLVHLSLSKKNRKQFFAEDVTMEGNIELGQQVIALFDECEIDWEEYLAQKIGDVPAYNVGKIVKKLRLFGKNLHETLLDNINEYAHEEIRLFPPAEELQDFYHEVDVLRMDVDRLDTRVEHLLHALNKEAQ